MRGFVQPADTQEPLAERNTGWHNPASPDLPVWLFDGLCGFCNASIRFYLSHERDSTCRFVAIQSAEGRRHAEEHGLDADNPTTFLFIEGGTAYPSSDGVIALARHLRWPWSLLRLWRVLPQSWRDRQYGWIARNRYRIAGRKEVCDVPPPSVRARFVLPASSCQTSAR